jgi:ABC-type phosphate/phosphonate transport system ATPase subunit
VNHRTQARLAFLAEAARSGAASRDAEVADLQQQLAEALAEIDRLNSPVILSEWQQVNQQLADAKAAVAHEADIAESYKEQFVKARADKIRLRELLRKWAFTHSKNEEDYMEVQEALADTKVEE